ncbi:hypothetical protein [Streptomyces sp. B6B3]|uniref:hypothetical protein n=1 Tax=Streptomyces sp. B6B3 TaxID=3153570 RepID=UPI00325DBC65
MPKTAPPQPVPVAATSVRGVLVCLVAVVAALAAGVFASECAAALVATHPGTPPGFSTSSTSSTMTTTDAGTHAGTHAAEGQLPRAVCSDTHDPAHCDRLDVETVAVSPDTAAWRLPADDRSARTSFHIAATPGPRAGPDLGSPDLHQLQLLRV